MKSTLATLSALVVVAVPVSASAHPGNHEIVSGDTLSKVAIDHGTTWSVLHTHNQYIINPNLIFPGNNILVPENLAVLPAPVAVPKPAPKVAKPAPKPEPVAVKRGGGGANTYTRGQCTWGVKNKRPDIPNTWGNASTWFSRAQAQGWPTGLTPRAGAIGQRDNHVVYVEAVLAGGQIRIWEQNYDYRGSIRVKVDSASRYRYIY